jgi:hypothetical protein
LPAKTAEQTAPVKPIGSEEQSPWSLDHQQFVEKDEKDQREQNRNADPAQSFSKIQVPPSKNKRDGDKEQKR